MGVNQVIYGGNTLIDLTNDTVTAETLAEGVTAHDASGEQIIGTMTASSDDGGVDIELPLSIENGGTGATTAEGALANLGAAPSKHEHSADDITDGVFPVARGGTGATTAEEARSNIGAAADFVTIGASGENLDNYTTAGWYYFRSSPTNIPSGSNGWLHVMTAPTLAIVKQVFYRYGTPSSNDYQTWVRTKNTEANGGTWGKWWRYAVIDEAVFTTKEVELTIADQTSYEMTTLAAYSRSGIVDVHINTKPVTVSSSWLTIATLPSGYRPPVNIYKVESYYNASSNYANLRLRITTAGAVQLCLGTANANYAFHASFIIA